MPNDKLGNILTATAVACAVTMTILVVRREFRPGDKAAQGAVRISDLHWSEILFRGEALGPDAARVTIAVFADFQCPACRDFAVGPLAQFVRARGDSVQVRFLNWPLQYHPLARGLAAQAVCAGRQGRFWQFHDHTFALQESLPALPADSVAKLAGVPDLEQWKSCLADPAVGAIIDRDVELVQAIGGRGTPTVVVNGRLYLGYPSLAELEQVFADPAPTSE